jgi:hypothetical protein
MSQEAQREFREKANYANLLEVGERFEYSRIVNVKGKASLPQPAPQIES